MPTSRRPSSSRTSGQYQHADDPAHQRAWPADGDQAAYPPPRSAGSSKVFGVILGILAASFIALGVWWMTHRSTQTDDVVGPPPIAPTSAPSTGASAASPPASPATSNLATSNPAPTTPAPTRTVAAEQARAALATLQSSRDAARARVTLDGHWAAQLASKHDGIVDPMQTTASGGHTFGYADILAEVQQLQGAHGTGVIVLRGTDFGRQTSRSKATFVTLYDAGFASSAQAQAWCAKAFPGVTGKALANKCVPRSLRAPYN